jgi:6-phosphogluconolactonase
MEGELPPELAAERYKDILLHEFPDPYQSTFDLMLLGLGEDGHTASIFPNTRAVLETGHLVMGYFVSEAHGWRLTLTAPVLNRARKILYLVSGETKANTLKNVLNGPYEPQRYPAQLTRLAKGQVFWFVDRLAAKFLS